MTLAYNTVVFGPRVGGGSRERVWGQGRKQSVLNRLVGDFGKLENGNPLRDGHI